MHVASLGGCNSRIALRVTRGRWGCQKDLLSAVCKHWRAQSRSVEEKQPKSSATREIDGDVDGTAVPRAELVAVRARMDTSRKPAPKRRRAKAYSVQRLANRRVAVRAAKTVGWGSTTR